MWHLACRGLYCGHPTKFENSFFWIAKLGFSTIFAKFWQKNSQCFKKFSGNKFKKSKIRLVFTALISESWVGVKTHSFQTQLFIQGCAELWLGFSQLWKTFVTHNNDQPINNICNHFGAEIWIGKALVCHFTALNLVFHIHNAPQQWSDAL